MSYPIYRQWKNAKIDDRPYLSVVIPAANHAEVIVPTIGAVISQMCDTCTYWELIVVDGGSTDGTVEFVAELGLPNLTLLQTGGDSTLTERLQQGVRAARGHYILITEPENLAPIDELDRLLAQVERGTSDIAVGQKDQRQARKNVAGKQSLLKWLRLSGCDAHTSLMLFRREAAKPLFPKLTGNHKNPGNEICELAYTLKYKVSCVPVRYAGV